MAYQNRHVEIIYFGIIGAVTGGATAYPVPGCGTWAEGANELQLPLPRGCRVTNLYVLALTAPGGAVVDTITVRRNGAADTTITCTLTGAQSSNNDTVNSRVYTVGERISVRYDAGAGSVAANIMIAVEVQFAE